jgi:hypothetical protein
MSRRTGVFGLTAALLASAAYLPTPAAAGTTCQNLASLTLPDGAVFNTSGVNGSGPRTWRRARPSTGWTAPRR